MCLTSCDISLGRSLAENGDAYYIFGLCKIILRLKCATILPAKSDSDVLFGLQIIRD